MAFSPSPWPSRLFDQNFGMCITPHDFLFPFYTTYNYYYRPWKLSTQSLVKDFGSTITNDQELFKVTLDVQHFRPSELSVKVANKQIFVEGRHEERLDEHGFVSRHFTRRYALPSNCIPEDVISNLSSDGVLTIVANKLKELSRNEKIVPVTFSKSCPLKDVTKSVINTDQKDRSAEMKSVDTCKKDTQIMLKEDHCCLLLKPELLREAASESSEIIVEKKEKVEEDKLKVCQTGKNTSEMLEQTFAKASGTAIASKEKCDMSATDKSAMSKSEFMEQKIGKVRVATSASGEKTSAALSTSGQFLEQICAKSSETLEEKFDLFDQAMSKSEEILEQEFKKTSAAKSEKAGHSIMTKSEISELSSTSSKISECIESSTSYKASMTSNIKEMSEELSDFVCDILSSELDKTLEIKK